MSISFSGVGSGLPISDWITALLLDDTTRITNLQTKESKASLAKSTLNSIESNFSTLRSSVETLTDSNLATSLDVFSQMKATSSDTTVATATAGTTAQPQTISLSVAALATNTTASSLTSIGQYASADTTLSKFDDGAITDGTFSIYADGKKSSITISSDSTVQDVIDQIQSSNSALSANYDETTGKFSISYDSSKVSSFSLGSNNDSSNFLNIMQLSTANTTTSGTTATVSSSNGINTFSPTSTLIDSSGNNTSNSATTITSGSFIIGGATFQVVAGKTSLNDLIKQINNSTDSGVTAAYDSTTGKLKLTSTNTGATAINLESVDGGSNFLTAMGLVDSSGGVTASQTLGKNAEIYINGSSKAIYSTSNTLTSDVTGLTGVSINLVSTTKNSSGTDSPISITIAQNTDSIVDALKSFIDNFNTAITNVNEETDTSGNLSSEFSLVSIAQNLRYSVTNKISGLSTYDSLAMIGITTGKVGSSISDNTTSLQFDEDTFLAALKNNPSEVRALLIGNSATGVTGVFQVLEDKLSAQLDSVNGYFTTRADSYDSQISSIEDSISRAEQRWSADKDRLTEQFTAMDTAIAAMQQQASSLSSL